MAPNEKSSLKRKLGRFQKLLHVYRDAVLEEWDEDETENIREKLMREAGPIKQIIQISLGVERLTHPTSFGDPWLHGLTRYYIDEIPADFHNWIQHILDDVSSALGRIDTSDSLQVPKQSQQARPNPRAFIAHGGQPAALTKLKEFLEALGCEPIIAEKQPSEDRSVNEQVEWCLDRSDCAIVLATAEDLQQGSFYARPNVYIELGRFQERFPGRTIYLLEEGAKLPTNVDEKIWAPFTQENVEEAFLKVVREMRAFGYLKAEVPE